MENKQHIWTLLVVSCLAMVHACKIPVVTGKQEQRAVPQSFVGSLDSSNIASINWKAYFNDQHLTSLIDSALANNQELNITLQEIEIGKNEVMARRGSICHLSILVLLQVRIKRVNTLGMDFQRKT